MFPIYQNAFSKLAAAGALVALVAVCTPAGAGDQMRRTWDQSAPTSRSSPPLAVSAS